MTIHHHWNDFPVIGTQILDEQTRNYTLENKRVYGDIIVGRQSSMCTFRNLYVTGLIRLESACFLNLFEHVWMGEGGSIWIGDVKGITGCGNRAEGCFVRGPARTGWGWLIQNQQTLCLTACASDVNSIGFLLNAVNGSLRGVSAESCELGLWAYECAHLEVEAPYLTDSQERMRVTGAAQSR